MDLELYTWSKVDLSDAVRPHLPASGVGYCTGYCSAFMLGTFPLPKLVETWPALCAASWKALGSQSSRVLCASSGASELHRC